MNHQPPLSSAPGPSMSRTVSSCRCRSKCRRARRSRSGQWSCARSKRRSRCPGRSAHRGSGPGRMLPSRNTTPRAISARGRKLRRDVDIVTLFDAAAPRQVAVSRRRVFSTASSSAARSNGLGNTAAASRSLARACTLCAADNTMTGMSAVAAAERCAARNAWPSMTGIIRSSTIRSAAIRRACPGLLVRRRHPHGVPLIRERRRQRVANQLVVVHDQNARVLVYRHLRNPH